MKYELNRVLFGFVCFVTFLNYTPLPLPALPPVPPFPFLSPYPSAISILPLSLLFFLAATLTSHPPSSTGIWTQWLASGYTETWSAGTGLPTGPELSRTVPCSQDPGPSPALPVLGPQPRDGLCQVHLGATLATTLRDPSGVGPHHWGWGPGDGIF